MGFFGFGEHVRGDFVAVVLLAVFAVVNFGVHFDKVYDTLEGFFLTDGKLDGNGVGGKSFAHHFDRSFEVRAVDVHFVYVSYTGNFVLISLAPYRFGLGFYAALRAEGCDRAVEYAERTLYFYREVNVSRSVDNVYSALVLFGETASRPVAGGCGGSDGYTPFLFLNHPVHGCRAVVRFADFMIYTCVVQNTLGRGGFTCVDMRHYTDVSGVQ